jgi:1,4-dihydroxy-2-naphthoate octaprenyltransferase
VRQKSEAHYVNAARFFTVLFAVLMIIVAGAFAYAKVSIPNLRIIPVVLGIAGFILLIACINFINLSTPNPLTGRKKSGCVKPLDPIVAA